MTTKTYLYRRPEHVEVRVIDRGPGNTVIDKGMQKIPAYAGLIDAIKATSMQGAYLVDGIRLIKKLAATLEYGGSPDLVDEYVVVTETEKALLINAVTQFNWSKYSTDTGNTVWTSWLKFLSGFHTELEEDYAFTWTEYDPLNPPVEYAEWKQKHAAALADWKQKVADAEAAKIAAKVAAANAPVTTAPVAPAVVAVAEPVVEPVAVAEPEGELVVDEEATRQLQQASEG